MTYLHNLRTPFLHGNFKPSDVLVPAKTLQPKIANFGLWDFKNFFTENAQPDHDYMELMNAFQAPEVQIAGIVMFSPWGPYLTLIRAGFSVALYGEGGLNQPTGLFELLRPFFTPKSVQTESQMKL